MNQQQSLWDSIRAQGVGVLSEGWDAVRGDVTNEVSSTIRNIFGIKTPATPAPQVVTAGGPSPTVLVLIAGLIIGLFVLLRR